VPELQVHCAATHQLVSGLSTPPGTRQSGAAGPLTCSTRGQWLRSPCPSRTRTLASGAHRICTFTKRQCAAGTRGGHASQVLIQWLPAACSLMMHDICLRCYTAAPASGLLTCSCWRKRLMLRSVVTRGWVPVCMQATSNPFSTLAHYHTMANTTLPNRAFPVNKSAPSLLLTG
jgi:hypothetical protein